MCNTFGSIVVLGVVLFSLSGVCFGQPFVSGSLPNPELLQTGYAIVSPALGSTAGLVTFETITQHVIGGISSQTTVLPSPLLTNTVMAVSSQGAAAEGSGVGIANPGTFTANVTLTLRNHDGLIVNTRTIILQPRNQVAEFLGGLFGTEPVGVTGLLSINSSNPIGVMGVLFNGTGFSETPTPVQLGLVTSVLPTSSFLFPHWAAGAGWNTRIIISNTLFTLQRVNVDFFSPTGEPLVSLPISIPGNGVSVVSPTALQ